MRAVRQEHLSDVQHYFFAGPKDTIAEAIRNINFARGCNPYETGGRHAEIVVVGSDYGIVLHGGA